MGIDIERLKTDAAYWDDLFSPCTKRIAIETDENGYIAQIATKHPLSGGSFEMISPNNSIKFVERPTKPAAPEWDGEGLPPVGRECEVHMHGDQWSKARVVGHDEEGGIPSAVCRVLDSYYAFSKKCVRPLRTKEQRQRDELVDFVATASGIRARDGRGAIALDIADAILARYSLEPKDD